MFYRFTSIERRKEDCNRKVTILCWVLIQLKWDHVYLKFYEHRSEKPRGETTDFKTSADFTRLQIFERLLKITKRLYKTSWDFKRLCETFIDFKKLQGTSLNFIGLHTLTFTACSAYEFFFAFLSVIAMKIEKFRQKNRMRFDCAANLGFIVEWEPLSFGIFSFFGRLLIARHASLFV
jgi:hypothetical protein